MPGIAAYRDVDDTIVEEVIPESAFTITGQAEPEPAYTLSFPRFALAELRKACPKLKKKRLLTFDCRGIDPIAPVNVMLNSRFCGVERHCIAQESQGAQFLNCAEGLEELAEWQVDVHGDSNFRTVMGPIHAVPVIGAKHAPGISMCNIASGIVEIRHRKEQGRLWLVLIERRQVYLDAMRERYLIHEPDDYCLRNAYLKLCGTVLHHIKFSGSTSPRIEVANSNGETWAVANQNWDDIYMTDEVRRSVRDDFRFFIENENWFRHHHLPFKRGYLLAGPPGNGKTSVLRVMAGTPGFTTYVFDFTREGLNNNRDLIGAFRKAGENAPCIFALEDVDRILGTHEDKQNQVRVTKDVLLNCLDGVGKRNGVVVVATANYPENLDEAILKRPGRFDRVVRFEPPDNAMRRRILSDLFAHEKKDDFGSLLSKINLSEGILPQIPR